MSSTATLRDHLPKHYRDLQIPDSFAIGIRNMTNVELFELKAKYCGVDMLRYSQVCDELEKRKCTHLRADGSTAVLRHQGTEMCMRCLLLDPHDPNSVYRRAQELCKA